MIAMLLSIFVMQQLVPPGVMSPTQRAQSWLGALYPELRGGNIAINVYGDDVTTRLIVMAQPSRRTPSDKSNASAILLIGDLHRSPYTGRLEMFRTRGSLVSSDRLSALVAAVRSHPEWTSREIDSEIVRLGGHYPAGAGPALLARLPSLTDIFGVSASLERVMFATAGATEPVWLIDVIAGHRDYRIVVEPFDGHVIELVAR